MPLPSIQFTRWRGAKLYLNLPIPADLRPRYATEAGKPRTHIVEALGTGDPTEGRRLARERQAFWELEFSKQRRGRMAELPSTIRKARELREAMAEAVSQGNPEAVEAVENLAVDLAEKVEAEAGYPAAKELFNLATQPGRMTLLEALGKLNESWGTEGTKAKRTQQLKELLAFLKVPDCLPDYVTEARAVAYVDWLNTQPLSYSTKQDRLSGLQSVRRYLSRKRQVSASASPWRDHELTKKKADPDTGEGGEVEKRAFTDEEIRTIFKTPDRARSTHYTRGLFRELYTLGFCTGMRLDEIVSLTPLTLEALPEEAGRPGGLLIKITKSKTPDGIRSIPVVHPAAVSILIRRIELQTKKAESIFPECRPGGPDNRLSWHVQKALGRDRDHMKFGADIDFHSTRRCFSTLLEQAEANAIFCQRYVGQKVPTMFHTTYSTGSSQNNLRKVADLVKYPPDIEELFAGAAGAVGAS